MFRKLIQTRDKSFTRSVTVDKTVVYQKRYVFTEGMSYYLDVSLEANTPVDDEHFLAHVKCCVKAFLGETGVAVPIDLLKYNPTQSRAILRCPDIFFVKLQTSLTLCGYYNNHPAKFVTHKTSPYLLTLISVN